MSGRDLGDMNDDDLKPRELAWRRYNLAVELYKFYWNGLLQLNSLIVAFAGGLTAYVLVNSSSAPSVLRWSLVLPMLSSLSQLFILATGWSKLTLLGDEIRETARALNVDRHLSALPLQILVAALILVHLLVAVGIFFLVVHLAHPG